MDRSFLITRLIMGSSSGGDAGQPVGRRDRAPLQLRSPPPEWIVQGPCQGPSVEMPDHRVASSSQVCPDRDRARDCLGFCCGEQWPIGSLVESSIEVVPYWPWQVALVHP